MAISVMLLQTIPFMTDAGYSRTTASLMFTVISLPALLSKPVWGYLIDQTDVRRLSALSAGMAGLALVTIVVSVQAGVDAAVYAGFFLLGAGWGGIIPLQEVVWASFFGRRYLGAVRSAGLPFSLILSAGGPLLVSAYFDAAGNYNGAFLAVAAACILAAGLMLLVRHPERKDEG
jgi:MFS family permease